MLKIILHYLSKYSLMFVMYITLLALFINFVSDSLLVLVPVTAIFYLILKFKIIEFSSCWLDRR